jgi:endonuclease/exonuclease/phosphatase family metal-dependent hydrolase
MFSILSLNTFGIPFFISQPRIKRIAEILNHCSPTVLCLQEIQQNIYLSSLMSGLPAYSNFIYHRNMIAPKGGLFTAAVPSIRVRQAKFFPYPNQGRPLSIGFSDWALNKGIQLVELEIDERCYAVMNTHLQANYLADWRPSNQQTRIQLDQVGYLAHLVHTQPTETWVIVCGDFNFPRHAPAYQELISKSGLVDAFAGDPRPTYKPFPLVSKRWKTSLDYMLYRRPEGDSAAITSDIISIVYHTARWSFQRFLTDHYALTLCID